MCLKNLWFDMREPVAGSCLILRSMLQEIAQRERSILCEAEPSSELIYFLLLEMERKVPDNASGSLLPLMIAVIPKMIHGSCSATGG